MPIRPENRDRYPADWPELSHRLKEAARWRCQCTGECGRGHTDRCPERHGRMAVRGRCDHLIVLTVAHLDHTPENNQPENLRVMCPGCHLHYDQPYHLARRVLNRLQAQEDAGQLKLEVAA